MRSIFAKAMHDQRRALIGWGAGAVLLILMEAASWPTIRRMPGIGGILPGDPETMRELFDMDAYGTGTGFLNAELFRSTLPLILIFFAVARGARAVAGEEEAGTLDVLPLTPATMRRLIVEQAAALAAGLGILGAVIYMTVLASSAVFDMDVRAWGLANGTLAIVLLGLVFGCLALAVGAATGRRGFAIGVASTAAVGTYVWYVAAQVVDAVHRWQWLSPFALAVDDGPIGAAPSLSYLAMVLVSALLLTAAAAIGERRDISRASPVR